MFQCSIHSHKTDSQNSGSTVVLVWCWKQVKDLILEFLISDSFFSEKKLSDYYTIIIVFFSLGRCIDEVVDRQTNYQGYIYDGHFLGCHNKGVC